MKTLCILNLKDEVLCKLVFFSRYYEEGKMPENQLLFLFSTDKGIKATLFFLVTIVGQKVKMNDEDNIRISYLYKEFIHILKLGLKNIHKDCT